MRCANSVYFVGAFFLFSWAGLATSLFADSFPLEQPLEWQFRVYLDNKEIGRHDFTLSRSDGGLLLETQANFDVKFLFITAYTYRHRNVETWDANGLASIQSYTDANGEIYELSGQREGDAFILRTRRGQEVLPEQLMTFAYWNPEILGQQQLLNSQTGEYERVDVVDRGVDSVEYRGQAIQARRYDLVLETVPVSVWYAVQDNRWVALESPTESGRVLRYEPLSLPQAPVELALLNDTSN